MPKLCPNITFPHQQDFLPIRSVTKSSTARFSHENLVEKFKIFVQDFVPIRTAHASFFFYPIVIKIKLKFFCDVHFFSIFEQTPHRLPRPPALSSPLMYLVPP